MGGLPSILPTPSETNSSTIKTAKIDGYFYLVVFAKNKEPIPFIVDTGASHTTMPPDVLETLGYKIPNDAKSISLLTADQRRVTGQLFTIPNLIVGPYLLKSTKIVVCETCITLLGQTTLEKFDLLTQKINDIEFLNIKLRP